MAHSHQLHQQPQLFVALEEEEEEEEVEEEVQGDVPPVLAGRTRPDSEQPSHESA